MDAARRDLDLRVIERDRPPYLAGLIAGSPQLRRDISNAVRVGVSPRRYAGWEPSTVHYYDEQGRLTRSRPEPEWDEWDQALIDELANWQAGLHSCGHHKDEQTDPDKVFVAAYTVCKACLALQVAQERQAGVDKPALKAGKNPDFPRWWQVLHRSRADLAAAAEQAAHVKSPLQRMQEALTKLDEGQADTSIT